MTYLTFHRYPRPSDSIKYCNVISTRICVETAEINLLHEGLVTPEECKCYEPCSQMEYTPAIHLMQFPSINYEFDRVIVSPVLSSPEEYKPMVENLLQIEVYYKGLNFHRFTEIQVYSSIQLISDIGRLEME